MIEKSILRPNQLHFSLCTARVRDPGRQIEATIVQRDPWSSEFCISGPWRWCGPLSYAPKMGYTMTGQYFSVWITMDNEIIRICLDFWILMDILGWDFLEVPLSFRCPKTWSAWGTWSRKDGPVHGSGFLVCFCSLVLGNDRVIGTFDGWEMTHPWLFGGPRRYPMLSHGIPYGTRKFRSPSEFESWDMDLSRHDGRFLSQGTAFLGVSLLSEDLPGTVACWRLCLGGKLASILPFLYIFALCSEVIRFMILAACLQKMVEGTFLQEASRFLSMKHLFL